MNGVTFNENTLSLEFSGGENWITCPGVDTESVTLVPEIGVKLNGRVYAPKKDEFGNIAYKGFNPFGPWGNAGKKTIAGRNDIIWNKLVCVHRICTIIPQSLYVDEYCAEFKYDEAKLERGFKEFIMLESVTREDGVESVPRGDGGKAESDDDDCVITKVCEDGPAKKKAKKAAK